MFSHVQQTTNTAKSFSDICITMKGCKLAFTQSNFVSDLHSLKVSERKMRSLPYIMQNQRAEGTDRQGIGTPNLPISRSSLKGIQVPSQALGLILDAHGHTKWQIAQVCFPRGLQIDGITMAAHLEVVARPSTDSFLQCLVRFVSRRGKPTDIYINNGTDFVGSVRELQTDIQKWYQKKVSDHLLTSERYSGAVTHPPLTIADSGDAVDKVKSLEQTARVGQYLKECTLTYEDLEGIGRWIQNYSEATRANAMTQMVASLELPKVELCHFDGDLTYFWKFGR
ncbi:unnamed protein product [Schistocephalus solidus]|uniref:Integrase catalytic domain-containing protein n=1 Tax=Schistocephalus solidus TaxID=70667 RepID=A0A3P7EPG7_SCHSO|nr:unnamed protein product [Schistocephalus solidus]